MNIFGFTRLIYNIYGRGDADIDMIQRQGLLAVKIGQMHALRIDFLPEEKCRQLAQLYRHTDSIPAEQMRELLNRYTDEKWASNFQRIEERPVASASITSSRGRGMSA